MLPMMPGPVGGAVKYKINRSLRFASPRSTYLSRTPAGAGSSTNKATLNWWMKGFTATNGTQNAVISTTGNNFIIGFNWSSYGGQMFVRTDGANDLRYPVLRDPGAHVNVHVEIDTTQATAANRIKVWYNGVQQPNLAGTMPSQNSSIYLNSATAHNIGKDVAGGWVSDMVLSAMHVIDGTIVPYTTFGKFDATTGQFIPKQVAGVSYGTNGFWLSFESNASAAALGYDDAGGLAGAGAGSNDWTVNAHSVTAGVNYDSLTDTPTNNFATFNPLSKGVNVTMSSGLLLADTGNVSNGVVADIMQRVIAGMKVYVEFKGGSSMATYRNVGINGGATYFGNDGSISGFASGNGTFATWGANDVIAMALDFNAGTVAFYKNGTLVTTVTVAVADSWLITTGQAAGSAGSLWFNAGQQPFVYTPPSGFKSFCTDNMPEPLIRLPKKHFDIDVFTGTGAARTKSGLLLQPDLAWLKGRSGTTAHAIYDSVRGAQNDFDTTSAVESAQAQGVTGFNADGYSTGTLAKLNTSAATYAAWLWKKGVTPGLDIVSYSGNGAARTIAHALGAKPGLIMVKERTNDVGDWECWHGSFANNEAIKLGSTAAKYTDSTVWNNTAPTSSVFSVGTYDDTNGSGDTYIAYLFAEVPGFSKFGTYVGNGSTDGPFVWCGFRPAFVMAKRADGLSSWHIFDCKRSPINPTAENLGADSTNAESAYATNNVDLLSTGFKLRHDTGYGYVNTSGGNYIFAAFAEAPFKYANAR